MLMGTDCRFSERFCEVTITSSSIALLVGACCACAATWLPRMAEVISTSGLIRSDPLETIGFDLRTFKSLIYKNLFFLTEK
jgi:hypothetical protein